MLKRIIRHEWRNLTADRTAWIVLLLFALVIGYAFFKGQAWARHQQSTLAQMQQDEEERLGAIRKLIVEEERKAAEEGKPLAYPAWGPRHPAYVGVWRGQRYAALPPAPLAPLAVGQTDVYPNHFKVSAGMKESFLIAQETESPFKLLAGQFDLAFVIIYFYPLLILALTFNLVASEKEDGTLRMLLSNRNQLVNRFRYLSPAILMQSLLYDITGAGVERYQHFLRQVDDYHQSWRRYFSPRVFEKRALASGDLASLPQFRFAEESIGAVIRRASWPGLAMALVTVLVGYAGLRGYRRFPVVE